jgi:hypothetical protein
MDSRLEVHSQVEAGDPARNDVVGSAAAQFEAFLVEDVRDREPKRGGRAGQREPVATAYVHERARGNVDAVVARCCNVSLMGKAKIEGKVFEARRAPVEIQL